MRLLLDTHILLWWLTGDRKLPKRAREVIASGDNDVAVSAAAFWEIAIKKSLGRIRLDLGELESAVKSDGFVELPIRIQHARQLESLPDHHGDPFDRMLIAQAIVESRQLVTSDNAMLAYRELDGFSLLAL